MLSLIHRVIDYLRSWLLKKTHSDLMCDCCATPSPKKTREKKNKNKRETRALLLVEIRNCFKRAVPFNSEQKIQEQRQKNCVLSPTHVINFWVHNKIAGRTINLNSRRCWWESVREICWVGLIWGECQGYFTDLGRKFKSNF